MTMANVLLNSCFLHIIWAFYCEIEFDKYSDGGDYSIDDDEEIGLESLPCLPIQKCFNLSRLA